MRRLILAVATLVTLLVGMAAPPATAGDDVNFYGSRWRTGRICVENRTDYNSATRTGTRRAISNVSVATNLNLIVSADCSGYAQRIIIIDAWYGKSGWAGVTDFNGWTWGTTNTGRGVWFNNSTIVIKLNTYYKYVDTAGWQHVATHEMGHAVGLDHDDVTCDSVMSQRAGCSFVVSLTSRDVRNINTIYSW